MLAHSIPLVSLGAFILIFGFFAFNGGSQASITSEGDGVAVSKAVVSTLGKLSNHHGGEIISQSESSLRDSQPMGDLQYC